MKKLTVISLVAVVLLLATAESSLAGGLARWRIARFRRSRCRAGVGLGVRSLLGLPVLLLSAADYSYGPPTVVVQQPPTYVQQEVAPLAPAEPPAPQAYWYYCSSTKAYYPSVQTCTEPWVKVPPRQE